MYNYKYTLEVSSWSENAQKYITDLVSKFNISYDMEKSLINPSQIILTLKGDKKELDKLELRLIKNLSSHTHIEDFTKTTTFFEEDILTDNSFFDIEESNLTLIHNSKKFENPLQECIKLLKSQKVGIIKNSNGYYICAISNKSSTIKKIRELTFLNTADLPLLVKNPFQAAKFVQLSKKEEELLTSDIKPLLKTKKKNLHRLEKAKNIPLNAVSVTNTYYIKMPKNFLEAKLVNEINIPLIFIRITNYKVLLEKVDFILTFEKDFLEYDDTIIQIVYGKTQIIKNGYGLSPIKISLDKQLGKNLVCSYKNSTSIASGNNLILSPSGLKKDVFFTLNNFKPDIKIENIPKTSLVKIHTYESKFIDSIIFEFSKESANIWLSKQLRSEKIYSLDKSPNEYFKYCLKNVATHKDLTNMNVEQICDNLYEICYEKSFKYTIEEKTISIFIEELPKNEIPSVLTNTFTNIVKEIYQKYELPVILCGDLFENKNLAENIIEFFDDNDIKYHMSSYIPVNNISCTLGAILDIIDKK